MNPCVPMRRLKTSWLGLAFVLMLPSLPAYAQGDSVLTYHAAPDRSGSFIVPGLSWDRARSLHRDGGFHAQLSGHVYAQPLYWQGASSDAAMLLVATEDATVYALDAATGHEIWRRSLGRPVRRSSLGCGNIDPLGITGTPVIDDKTAAIYLDAALEEPSGPRHRLFALSLEDGKVLPGWPVDVTDALRPQSFNARDQNQRGALAILDGTIYVPFGGHYGDCGSYHGWVVGVSIADPGKVTGWSTRARGGGIWAPGGISSDGQSLFVATGNTFGASTWSDGEAVFRLSRELKRSTGERDFFAPKDWLALDRRDADLGGTGAIPLDIPSRNGTQALVLAFGKDGRAYILDRGNLGGIGGSLMAGTVSTAPIRTAPATFAADGAAFVALQAPGAQCPRSSRGGGLTVLKIGSGSPPTMTTAWCADLRGAGSPIVTTTDGHSNPIVWILGAEGDNRLHGFKGDTGEVLFSGGGTREAMAGLRHFQTLIATKNRLFVAADGQVYAFAF